MVDLGALQGARLGEKGSAADGALIREVAASADMVVHTAAVLRSRVRDAPDAPGPLRAP